jgi:chromosomal replication initiation ATPase DnaA
MSSELLCGDDHAARCQRLGVAVNRVSVVPVERLRGVISTHDQQDAHVASWVRACKLKEAQRRYADHQRLSAIPSKIIVSEVAARFKTTAKEVAGDCRLPHIMMARHIAFHLMHEMKPHLSLRQIIMVVAPRHHSTVISSLRKVKALKADERFAELLDDIKADILIRACREGHNAK